MDESDKSFHEADKSFHEYDKRVLDRDRVLARRVPNPWKGCGSFQEPGVNAKRQPARFSSGAWRLFLFRLEGVGSGLRCVRNRG